MSLCQFMQSMDADLEGSPSDFRRLAHSLQQKQEQLIVVSEAVSQLREEVQRKSSIITTLRHQLTDSQFKIDALESEVQDNQHIVNHLREHQYLFQGEKADLTDKLRVATDQISEQRTTIEFLRRRVQQQEAQNALATEQHFDDGQKHQAALKEIRQKYSALMVEKKRMKIERTKMNRRNKFLEDFAAQMTIENLKVNQRAAQMDRKLEGCSEEIERQNELIEGLRAQNLDLLDRNSQIDIVEEDEDIKDLIDQCIQVDIAENVDTDIVDGQEMPVPELEDTAISCCEGAGEDEGEDEGEDLLTLIQQYEDHEDYLKQEEEEEEEQEEGDEEVTETRNKEKIIAKLVMEGIQREVELNKLKKSSDFRKRGLWNFFTSRIETMRWI